MGELPRRKPAAARMKQAGLIALALLPALVLIFLSLQPYTHSDLGYLALPFGLPVLFLTWLVFIFCAESKRPILKNTWPLLLSSALVVSIWMTDRPLHLAFERAKPELNRIADRIERGEKPGFPLRAGLFTVRDGSLRNPFDPFETRLDDRPRMICLWVILKPSGNTGFVRSPDAGGYSAWSKTTLSTEWMLVTED